MADLAAQTVWTARSFFQELAALSPLRVISVSGPSTFEAICRVDRFGIADGYLNAITPDYHWHLDLRGFRHLRSRDEVHERSGRQVLFFELRSGAEEKPFLRIYVHREKGEEFEPERRERFAQLHAELASGQRVAESVTAEESGT